MVAVRGHKSIAFVFADQRASFDKKNAYPLKTSCDTIFNDAKLIFPTFAQSLISREHLYGRKLR